MNGGLGHSAGEGVSCSESPGQPAPSPAWRPVCSLTGDGESRAQAPQREGLQGWTLAAACLGHTQERGGPTLGTGDRLPGEVVLGAGSQGRDRRG